MSWVYCIYYVLGSHSYLATNHKQTRHSAWPHGSFWVSRQHNWLEPASHLRLIFFILTVKLCLLLVNCSVFLSQITESYKHNSARFNKLQEILAVEDLTPKNREMNFSKSKEEDKPEHWPAVKPCEWIKKMALKCLFKLIFFKCQHAKKVVSDSRGLVDFAIGLVNSVLNLPDGQVKFFEEFKLKKNCEINSAR